MNPRHPLVLTGIATLKDDVTCFIVLQLLINKFTLILIQYCLQKSDVIPSLPKPKSSVSPKLGRNTPTSQAETSKTSNGSADLLGLDTAKPEPKPSTNDDIFSSFFSAPEKPLEPKPEESKPDLKTEEENFFKQPAPTEKEKSKLTKDSILALYSQTPSNTLASQFNPVQPIQNTYPFGTYQPYNNMPMQNGIQSFNQFQSMPNQFPAFPTQMPPQPQNQQNQNQPFQQNFFNQNQSQLSQQFSGLNLGQFPNAFPPNPNMASNSTWQ